jgi:hypothetical protein
MPRARIWAGTGRLRNAVLVQGTRLWGARSGEIVIERWDWSSMATAESVLAVEHSMAEVSVDSKQRKVAHLDIVPATNYAPAAPNTVSGGRVVIAHGTSLSLIVGRARLAVGVGRGDVQWCERRSGVGVVGVKAPMQVFRSRPNHRVHHPLASESNSRPN